LGERGRECYRAMVERKWVCVVEEVVAVTGVKSVEGVDKLVKEMAEGTVAEVTGMERARSGTSVLDFGLWHLVTKLGPSQVGGGGGDATKRSRARAS